MSTVEHMDVERLAREAGAAKFYPEAQKVKEQNYLVGAGFLEKFAALVLEEAAKVCDDKAAAIRLYCNEAHVVECADELRALAAGVR